MAAEVSPFKNIELEDKVKTNLVFKKFMEDSSYRELIAKKFKYQLFEEFPVAVPTQFAIKYFEKYKRAPDVETLKSITRKGIAGKPKFNENLIISSIDNALSTNIRDEDLIRHSVINIISSKIAFNLLITHIDEIKEQKDVSFILKELNDVQSLSIDQELGLDYFVQLSEHLEELANPQQRMITGYPTLDEYLGGGWLTDGRMLGIFMSPTHTGKSMLLSNLAIKSLEQGDKFVVIISLEMSEFVYASRIDAHISKYNINEMQFNVEKVGEKIYNFNRLYPNSKLLIKEFPTKTVSANDIGAYLERVQQQYKRKIDIVYLDYLTLLNPSYSGKNIGMYEKGDAVSNEVRALSYKFRCPFISAVQSGRASFKAESIGMENTSESIAIPANVDFMASLYKPNMPDVGDTMSGQLNCEILKNRLGGRCGETIQFQIDYTNLTIEEHNSSNDIIEPPSKKLKNAAAELTQDLDTLDL